MTCKWLRNVQLCYRSDRVKYLQLTRTNSIMKKFASAAMLLTMLGVSACAVSPAQYVQKGNALFDSGKYADAEINYQKALQKDPNLGEAYYRLGLTKMREAQPAEAYRVLSRAAELLPKKKR